MLKLSHGIAAAALALVAAPANSAVLQFDITGADTASFSLDTSTGVAVFLTGPTSNYDHFINIPVTVNGTSHTANVDFYDAVSGGGLQISLGGGGLICHSAGMSYLAERLRAEYVRPGTFNLNYDYITNAATRDTLVISRCLEPGGGPRTRHLGDDAARLWWHRHRHAPQLASQRGADAGRLEREDGLLTAGESRAFAVARELSPRRPGSRSSLEHLGRQRAAGKSSAPVEPSSAAKSQWQLSTHSCLYNAWLESGPLRTFPATISIVRDQLPRDEVSRNGHRLAVDPQPPRRERPHRPGEAGRRRRARAAKEVGHPCQSGDARSRPQRGPACPHRVDQTLPR